MHKKTEEVKLVNVQDIFTNPEFLAGYFLIKSKMELDSAIKSNCRKGFVYVLTDGVYFKIGKTKNTVDLRRKQMSVGNPSQIDIVLEIATNNIDLLEVQLHEKYRQKKVKGEWFKLSKKDLKYIKKVFYL